MWTVRLGRAGNGDDVTVAEDRRRARGTGTAGHGGRRAARRRRHRALHRPLPQGGHRRRSTTPSCAPSRNGCGYLRELEERRAAILESIESQGKLDDALRAQIMAADSKARLEDIYLPYKPKRRTKAQIAREAGLEPLADRPARRPRPRSPSRPPPPSSTPSKGVADAAAALDGARAILVERFAEDADLIGALRERMWKHGAGSPRRSATGKEEAGAKFADYFELLRAVHQAALAPDPGPVAGREGGDPRPRPSSPRRPTARASGRGRAAYEAGHRPPFRHRRRGPARRRAGSPTPCAGPGGRGSSSTSASTSAPGSGRRAEDEAVRVFAANLRDLLLAAPAGTRPTMGLDPGFRTGVKVAVVDATGKVVATDTIYPHEPRRRLGRARSPPWPGSPASTASSWWPSATAPPRARPTSWPAELISRAPGPRAHQDRGLRGRGLGVLGLRLRLARSCPGSTCRCGARCRSPAASRTRWPSWSRSTRKSIGVGQYQHDVAETKLSRSLDAVVEDCVNAVGVDVNTASVAAAARVSGHRRGAGREHRGPPGRQRPVPHPPGASRRCPGSGPRPSSSAQASCASAAGDDPLDASGVHPEAYPVVRRILAAAGSDIRGLIGNPPVLRALEPAGLRRRHLRAPHRHRHPGRAGEAAAATPARPSRPPPSPRAWRRSPTSKPGMVLEGVVTNVAAFGAFVDVGVHQDGLVHISALSTRASSRTPARWSSPATWCGSRSSASTWPASGSPSRCAWTSDWRTSPCSGPQQRPIGRKGFSSSAAHARDEL